MPLPDKFNQSKKNVLVDRLDKSNEGQIDEKIRKLCDKLNKHKDFYTTSSCAGRIVLIRNLPEKSRDVFLFKSHGKVKFEDVKKKLVELEKAKEKSDIYFKQEPCILVTACRTLEDAQRLVTKARFLGWRRSGIVGTGEKKKRFVCDMMSTEKLDTIVMRSGKILISDDYLRILIEEANKKLEKTWKKIDNLEKGL